MPTVVVARYRESVDWLGGLPAGWKAVVYDKSGDNPPLSADWIPRPNIGLEAETFAYHNLTREPDDYTVFLQGRPHDHCATPFESAQQFISEGVRIGWLGHAYYTGHNDANWSPDTLGLWNLWPLLFPDRPIPEERQLTFCAGAQLVVRRDAIEAWPRDWWQRTWEASNTADYRLAHCFERLWSEIYKEPGA